MLIEEMLNKRDMSTNICVAFQNQIGKEITGVFEMDDLESRKLYEFHDYCHSEMKRLNFTGMIFTGWAFTKELYYKMNAFVNFEEDKDLDEPLYVLYFPEIITLMVFKSKEDMVKAINNMKPEAKRVSFLNINNIENADNGIIIHYFDHSVVKYFEEKPKSIDKIIEPNE